jgi:uncharacterized protein YbaP (TraB family)
VRIRARLAAEMRISLPILLSLAWLGGAQAGEATCPGRSMLPDIERSHPEAYQAALADFAAVPNSSGLLWKIEKNGADPSWLFGTIHIPIKGLTEFKPAIRASFDQSDQLVVESSEILATGKLELSRRIMPFARYEDETQSFDRAFSQEEKDKLATLTAAIGIPYFTARHLKPWFLAMTLSIPPCIQLAAMRGDLGVDARLREDALAEGKQVIGLETADEQIAAIASIDRAGFGPDELLEIIRQGPAMIDDVMATEIELYREERPAFITYLGQRLPEFKNEAEASAILESLLIHDRNLRMRDRLLPLLTEGGLFVAVGAMHLIGEDGLVELLRAAGYTLTRID